MKVRKNKMTILAAGLCLKLTSVQAMVDPGVDLSHLTAQLDGNENIGTIVADSENKYQLYVRPTSKKFQGRFYQTAGAVNCNELFEMRQITYRYPTEENFEKVVRSNQVYSPAFEANVGIFAKATGLIFELNQAKRKAANYIQSHKEEYGRYESTKAHLERLVAELDQVRESIATSQQDLMTRLTVASSSEERESIKEEYRSRLVALNSQEQKLFSQKFKASKAYSDAFEAWAPYKDQLDWLTKIEKNLSDSFSHVQNVAEESLRRSEELISALENKTIGYASAAYSFNPDSEIKELRAKLSSAGLPNYNVAALPVFNVRLNPGVTKSVKAATDNMSKLSYEMITYNFPSETRHIVSSAGEEGERQVTFPLMYQNEDGSDQSSISMMMTDLDGSFGGSQSFEIPVTMGAICGYPITEKKKYEYVDDEGVPFSRDVTITEYKSPAPNQPVFVQNVALRYNYYEKAKPIKGKCSLDLSQTSNYWRNSGKKSGWRWFSKVTHSWDDTTHNLASSMGLQCSVTEAPVGKDEIESKQMNREMQNMLYQDMFSMFLMTYAKDYKVTAVEPSVSDEKPQLFSNLGNGIMNICGTMKGCQVANIVLKTMDELVGTRHSGATSNRTSSTGKLTRDMSIQSYIVQEGFADFEMRVCVDHKQCE